MNVSCCNSPSFVDKVSLAGMAESFFKVTREVPFISDICVILALENDVFDYFSILTTITFR